MNAYGNLGRCGNNSIFLEFVTFGAVPLALLFRDVDETFVVVPLFFVEFLVDFDWIPELKFSTLFENVEAVFADCVDEVFFRPVVEDFFDWVVFVPRDFDAIRIVVEINH